MAYIAGDTLTLGCTFAVAATGVVTDPTTVTLRVKDPAGAVTVYTYALAEITKSTTGIYVKTLAFSTAGDWWLRWEGTGAAAGVEEQSIGIQASRVV